MGANKIIVGWKFRGWLISIVVVLAPLAGAFLDECSAYAQEEEQLEYVDLALMLEAPVTDDPSTRNFNVIVANHGARTAYDVEVVVNVVYPENSSYFALAPGLPAGSASLENDRKTFRWTIPALGGLQRVETGFRTFYTTSLTVRSRENFQGNLVFDKGLDPHEFFGEVTTSSFESDLHKRNNKARIWSTGVRSGPDYRFSQKQGLYSVDSVSVDERHPSAGDIVNFTIDATILNTNIDIEVAIALTDGLAVDVDSSATPARAISYELDPSTSAPPSYSDGVFTIGTRSRDERISRLSATLPVRVATSTDVVVNEQCLTATITGTPPPGGGPLNDDISDNVAKACLGEPPDGKVVFSDGKADLWVLYPCVGATSTPCDDTDSVVLAVNGLSAAIDSGAPYSVFEPENVVVHIPDHVGRNVSGGSISWNNGHDTDNSQWGVGILPGVAAKFERSLVGTENYSQLRASIEVDAPGDGADKGHMSVLFAANLAVKFFDTAGNTPLLSYGPVNETAKLPLLFRFTRLGTYTFGLTMGALYDSDPTDLTLPADPADLYSDTATYTFHVGPMADLEVQDGGASPHVVADRNALTIVAANNGPDPAPEAQVTGLPTDAVVIHVSHVSYDETAGEWNIGELRARDYYRSRGETEPTLVLGVADGDTANVSIANQVDYTVCIDSSGNDLDAADKATCTATTTMGSWYTTPVYDYDPGNSTTTITAAHGTYGEKDGSGEGAPGLESREAVGASSITVAWDAVHSVNSIPVSHYEVQRLENPWVTIASRVEGTEYVDTDVSGGETHQYRVRAVNGAGVPGLWSASMTGAVTQALADEPQVPGGPTVYMVATTITPMVRINSPILVGAVFSEAFNGFTERDATVANSAISNFSGSDGDAEFTFEVTPNAVGVVTVDIAADVAQDSEGNFNTAAAQLVLGLPYDDDHDGAIGSDEVVTAIADYLFNGLLNRDQVVQIITLYLFG